LSLPNEEPQAFADRSVSKTMTQASLTEHPMVHGVREWIIRTPRLWKRVIMISADIFLLLSAMWGSYALRLSEWLPDMSAERVLLAICAPMIAIPIFIRFGLYRSVIRYLPEAAIWTIIRAMLVATISWLLVIFLMEMAGQGIVPRSVPFFYFILATLFIGGIRFGAKWILNSGTGMRRDEEPILIYGAGPSAAQLARALRGHANRYVMGLIDDDHNNRGRDIGGYRVFHSNDLPLLIDRYGIREIVLCMSSIPIESSISVINGVAGLGVKVRSVPDMADIVDGRYIVNQIREIEIDELLGRSFVPADKELLGQALTDRAVMVTGAGGSIGSELCRLIVKWRPRRLVLLDTSEYALYEIERELRHIGGLQIVPVLGSVTDERLLRRVIRANAIEVLYHAAAYKHVPLVEENVLEAIRNNVFGTLTAAKIAVTEQVSSFVLISSDKAVRPTNVMGATKRWAELIVRQMAKEFEGQASGQTFCAVRFGNVIGSNGSVVPLFKQRQGWTSYRNGPGYDAVLYGNSRSCRTYCAGWLAISRWRCIPSRHGGSCSNWRSCRKHDPPCGV